MSPRHDQGRARASNAVFLTAVAVVLAVSIAAGASAFATDLAGGPSAGELALDVRDFGAKCDGVSDDAAAINAALAAAARRMVDRVSLPASRCVVRSTISLPGGVTLIGRGGAFGGGMNAGVADLDPMIRITGPGAALRDVYVNVGAAGANRSGWAIQMSGAFNNVLMDNVVIDGACSGMDLSGSYFYINNVTMNTQNAAGGSGCEGMRIGRHTSLGAGVDGILSKVEIVSTTHAETAADVGIDLQDAGGLFISHAAVYGTKIGTRILPGVAAGGGPQEIDFVTIDNSTLGDTSTVYSLLVGTTVAANKIRALACSFCWASSAGKADVRIANDGVGVVSGLQFIGLRSIGAYAPGGGRPVNNIEVDGGSDISIVAGGVVCGYSHAGVMLGRGVSEVKIDDETISNRCQGESWAGEYALLLAGDNDKIILANNNLTVSQGAATHGAPIGDSSVTGNIGLGAPPTIEATRSIDLSALNVRWDVVGDSPIETIGGGWNDRQVELRMVGGRAAFKEGGNLCNALASIAADGTVMATYDGPRGCWRLR